MTGIDLGQLKQFVIIPTLTALGSQYASPSAINLIAGIVAAESRGTYLRQITPAGFGPARGLTQMEPATHDDCWSNFLLFPEQSALASKIRALLPPYAEPSADFMIARLDYMVAMTRAQLWRSPIALPPATDAPGLAAYHKIVWNTSLGAADAAANIVWFKEAIAA